MRLLSLGSSSSAGESSVSGRERARGMDIHHPHKTVVVILMKRQGRSCKTHERD